MSKKKKVSSEKIQNSEKQKEPEEEISIDFRPALAFMKKYSFVFLLIIPLLLSVYIRTIPERLPVADDWARSGIESNIKNQLAAEILKSYPNLPQQNLQPLVEERYKQVYAAQGADIETIISQQSDLLRQAFRDDSTGYTYLGDIDSYFWLRYARNIVETGNIGDEMREGVPYDTRMVAPVGARIIPNIYPYIEAFLYKAIKLFNPRFTLMQAGFYTPLFLSFFAIIAAFLIGRKLTGNLGGFLAAVLIAVNPIILGRSLGSDNDIVNAVFPLIIMFFVLSAFDAGSLKKKAGFTLATGFFMGFYSFAWSGWWFLFLFIILAAVSYLGYHLFFEIASGGINKLRKGFFKGAVFKGIALFIFVFMLSTFLSLLLFGNQSQFVSSFFNPFKIVSLKEASKGFNLWPNVYTTVAELNEADIPQILNSFDRVALGSPGREIMIVPIFFLAFVGILFSLVNIKPAQENKKIILPYVFLSGLYYVFLGSGIIKAGNGILQAILWVFIVSIALGWHYLKNKETRELAYLGAIAGIYSIALILAAGSSIQVIGLFILISFPIAIGIVLSLLVKIRLDAMHSLLILIWFIGTIYAATKGVRFLLLIVPAFIIGFTAFVAISVKWLSSYISRTLDINKTVTGGILILIALLVVIQPVRVGYQAAYSYIPNINDAWVQTLEKIKAESSPDAIINSWWDFGHWFKYFADRKVTFDGASQNNAQAHWIGKVLLTDDERQAVAILRMLDCGANNAFEALNEEYNDTHGSIKKIYSLLEMEEPEARAALRESVGQEKADKISEFLFCSPPENYFITSEDMVGKAPVWAHFGIWSFDRAEMYNYYTSLPFDQFISALQARYGYTKEDAQRKYYEISALGSDKEVNDWIAPWPSYISAAYCQENSQLGLECQIQLPNGQSIPLSLNLTSKESEIKTVSGTYYPNSFGYLEDGIYKVKRYSENQLGYGIVLLSDNRTVVLMSDELVGSMFTRLFYLNGAGLEHFKSFHDVSGISGTRIITWKLDW